MATMAADKTHPGASKKKNNKKKKAKAPKPIDTNAETDGAAREADEVSDDPDTPSTVSTL